MAEQSRTGKEKLKVWQLDVILSSQFLLLFQALITDLLLKVSF